MAHKIQIRRGNKANLPTLDAGEFGLCQDTNELFIGNDGNQKIFPTETLRTARFVIGTSTAGWTAADCDYLCDGTNDQTEINAAITALPATGGEIVILDGTYNITDTILLNKTCSLVGKKAILNRAMNFAYIIGITADNCVVEGFKLDGKKANYTIPNGHGIYIISSNNKIRNNEVIDCLSTGIFVREGHCNNISENKVSGCQNGIGTEADDNVFYSNTIARNFCDSNLYNGILIGDSGTTCFGNVCTNNNYRGICVDYYDLYGTDALIIGNRCNDNGRAGIALYRSEKCTIVGNICIRGEGLADNYTTTQYTIHLDNSMYNLVSSNNCMGKAVVVSGTGNSVWGNKWDAGNDLPV